MADLNSFSFTGRLSKDALVKTLPSGKTLVEMDVANNIGFGDYAKTNWLKIKMWGERAANVAPIFKKGSLIGGSGELGTEEYDARDGTHRVNLVVTCMTVQLLASKKADSNTSAAQTENNPEDILF